MKTVWEGYKDYHRLIDLLWVTTVVTLSFTVLKDHWPLERAASDTTVYASIATIAGALLGFAITSISVLIAFLGGDEFKWLREDPEYESLFKDFKEAIILFSVTTVVSLVALLLNDKDSETRNFVMLGAALWLALLSSITLMHAMRILWLAIKAHGVASRDD